MASPCLIKLPLIVGLAFEVLAGEWGSGLDRVKRLEDAGYDYDEVQSCVNDLCDLLDEYKDKENE